MLSALPTSLSEFVTSWKLGSDQDTPIGFRPCDGQGEKVSVAFYLYR